MEGQSKVEELAGNVKEYVNIQVELVKLSVADKSSAIMAEAALFIAIALIGLLFSLAVTMALGYWLAYLTGSNAIGFLIVAGIYLLKAILIIANRKKWILDPIRDRIIKKIFSDEQQ